MLARVRRTLYTECFEDQFHATFIREARVIDFVLSSLDDPQGEDVSMGIWLAALGPNIVKVCTFTAPLPLGDVGI